jgi:hypothetical protein
LHGKTGAEENSSDSDEVEIDTGHGSSDAVGKKRKNPQFPVVFRPQAPHRKPLVVPPWDLQIHGSPICLLCLPGHTPAGSGCNHSKWVPHRHLGFCPLPRGPCTRKCRGRCLMAVVPCPIQGPIGPKIHTMRFLVPNQETPTVWKELIAARNASTTTTSKQNKTRPIGRRNKSE